MTPTEAALAQYNQTIIDLSIRLGQAAAAVAERDAKIEELGKIVAQIEKKVAEDSALPEA
jgi:hypothetical protein